ncbi:hypothetical protein N7486_004628 [Penicillium sp. IBT 16267x]|nr:hypothetical protein N7486_004628 [Penicillium sp. IBT 16267x]
MAPTELLTRPAELWQQSTNKMQRSTTDIWRRSTNLWYDSKDKCHQTSMEVWHRSADSWTNSKEKYHQNTVNAWHRSTGSWTNSMTRCLQSTDKSTTSANKLQTTGNEKKIENETTIASATLGTSTPPAPAEPAFQPSHTSIFPYSPGSLGSPGLTRSLPSSQTMQYIPYSKPSPRSRSQSESDTNSTSSSSLSIDLDIDKKNAADQQTKDLIELSKRIDTDLGQAKRLRDSKSAQLGEIEHNWINSTITDAKDANQEMTQILDFYRLVAEKRKGKLNSSSRKRWRTQDCQRVREKYPRLVLHQSRLEKVLIHLTTTMSVSPDISPEEPTWGSLSTLPLCEATVKSFVELPVEYEIAASLPVIAELPSEQALIGELPAVSSTIKRNRMLPVPKIIVTQVVEDLLADQKRSKEMDEYSNYENKEMDEMMAWEKTRNDIQMQQSESLARIFAEMEKKSMR